MRRSLISLAVGILTIATSGITLAGPDKNSQELFANERRILSNSQKTYSGGTKAGSALNMAVVGHESIGNRGFNGDVWVHNGFAYVGHWGFMDWATGNTRFCPEVPASGVAVIDVRNPSSPRRVATLQNPPNTSAEDVVAYLARSGPLAGRHIAVTGLQTCGSRLDLTIPRGLMLWDVTDAAHPATLGIFSTGCCTRGVHEFEVGHRPDGRTFAYVSVPFSELADASSPSGTRDVLGRGDARIIDITDPRSPFEVSTFGIRKDLGIDPASIGQGCDPDTFGHGMTPSVEGNLLVVSYWDAGFIALDTTIPETPKFLSRTIYKPWEDGDAHSASYDDARKLLFSADEDFCKGGPAEQGWGYMRIWDYSDPRAPQEIAQFKTVNSLGSSDPGAGDYVIHNPLVIGTDVYISWYTDGVRVVDASNPRAPREVAYFVPPAGQNPVKPAQRGILTNTAQIWGVVVDETTGLVYASDMNSGLWILRRTDR